MGTRNLLYVWVSASVAGEKKSDHCIPGGKKPETEKEAELIQHAGRQR